MNPFRTLKVQHGGERHMGWLKKRFAHIAAYSVFNPKKQHRTLANFLFGVFGAPCRFQMDISVPKCTHLEP